MLADEDLQRRLAVAFHEVADPVAPFAVQPALLYRQAIKRRRRTAAGSVLALASALAIAVSLVAVTGTPGNQAGALLAAKVTTAPPVSAAERGMPRFYVSVPDNSTVAELRSSVTGRLVSAIQLPTGIDTKMTQVAAAADDRTFVLAMFSLAHGTRFYKLQVSAAGRSAGLTLLTLPPLPIDEMADSIALTPDGTRLAVGVQRSGHGWLEVITVATGAVRTWSTTSSGVPENLSWARGQELGYFWSSSASLTDGLWLLNSRAPGTKLLSGRQVLPGAVGQDSVESAMLSPDARTAIAAVSCSCHSVGKGTIVGGIVQVSVQTGQPLHTLLALRAPYSPDGGYYITSCLLGAIDATGSHLLVSCDRFGRLDRGRFTALPGAAPQTSFSAAW